jgi:nucleotide-binding universal stress UspA family protein
MKMLMCSIGSKKMEETLRFGAEVAKALAGDVLFLGVVEKAQNVPEVRAAMERIARQLNETGVVSEIRVEVGEAEDVVLSELGKRPYDLLAVGALAGKRSRKALLGSVAMRIIEQVRCSVLVIKGERTKVRRVLICASGRELGQMVIWAGTAVACGAGAHATLLHVVDAMPAMYAGLGQMEESFEELLLSGSETARELKWAAKVVETECRISEFKLSRGTVPEQILAEGKSGDYDLIVLGSSRASGGLVRALMGDVSRDIVHRADRPVLVVAPRA